MAALLGELPADRAIGPYAIEGLLGRGGQATVYRARHRDTGDVVALKVPHAAIAPRLAREARILTQLGHPNIVSVLDASFDGPVPYIAMELVDGGSLADLLRDLEGASLGPTRARLIALSVLAALQHAHTQGVIHRDLKPANILLGRDGTVKVADFGIGRLSLTPEEGQSLAQSLPGTFGGATFLAGTPAYMAPEQERQGANLDGRTDLYAFGKLLYEMLTGRSPRTVKPIARGADDSLAAWESVIFRLVEDDPRDRYPSASAAHEAIRRLPVTPASTAASAALAHAMVPASPAWGPIARVARNAFLALLALFFVFAFLSFFMLRAAPGSRPIENRPAPVRSIR